MIPILFKSGVVAINPHWSVQEILHEAVRVWYNHGKASITVTSIGDGVHSTINSSHYTRGYVGPRAVDFRTRDDKAITQWPQEEKESLRDDLSAALGHKYYVRLEKDHIHVNRRSEFL